MSDNTPTPESTDGEAPEPLIEPAAPNPDETLVSSDATSADEGVRTYSSAGTVEPESRATPVAATPVAATPVAKTPVSESRAVDDRAAEPTVVAPVAAEPVRPVPPPPPSQQVMYVEAPQPPRKKGNRAIGALIALVSAVLFAVLYGVILLIVELVAKGSTDVTFLQSRDFWVPVIAYAVGFIIMVLIVNRAGWPAHVLGSLFVGAFVYFATGGALVILNASRIPPTEVGAALQAFLFSTGAIVAALLARELSLWVGFAIAARGRRVKARNVQARESYDREVAQKRGEYERQNSAGRGAGDVYPLGDS